MTSTLRAGVIGAGVFGGYHAAKYAEARDVTLTAVLDPHPERAQGLADRFGGQAFADLGAFFAAAGRVPLPTPALHHRPLALTALPPRPPPHVGKPTPPTPPAAAPLPPHPFPPRLPSPPPP